MSSSLAQYHDLSNAVESTPVQLPAVLHALKDLVVSAEPAVTFTSAVRLCAPALCDSATAVIAMADQPPYSITWPRRDKAVGTERGQLTELARADHLRGGACHRITDNAVFVPIAPTVAEGQADYRGVLILRFEASRPDHSHLLLGQLIVDRVLATITAERLTERQAAEAERAGHLETALITSREIGMAMGIIMAQHKLTGDSAFDLLRRISQHSHRKLRDVALTVADTGAVDLPSGVTLVAARG
jgi:hypothetical protein